MFELANGVLADARMLVIAALVVMGLGMTAMVWAVKRSAVAVIGTLLLTAVVGWGASNADFLQQRVDQDMQQYQVGG